MITIKNLRTEKPQMPYDVKVDRSSVLGNPFPLQNETQRDIVCDKYEKWLRERIANKDKNICDELNRLYRIAKQYNKLNLFCWCFPKRCHAETIRLILLEKLQ